MPRETLASSSSSSSSSTSSSGANNPPPEDAWVDAYQRLLPQWQSLSLSPQSIIPISISRVNQVDAQRLDIEMSAMLKEQLVKVFSLVKPGLLFQYEPELDAFLEFLIWRFSIWVDMPTPGNALMNLRYRDERAIEPRGKGLAKILKKYDKRTGGLLCSPFIQNVLQQLFYTTDLISKLVKECESTINAVFPVVEEEGIIHGEREEIMVSGEGVFRNTVAALLTMQEIRRGSSTYGHFSLPPLNLPDSHFIQSFQLNSPIPIP